MPLFFARYLDSVNIMTYDLYGPWDSTTGHNSPLHRGKKQAQLPTEKLFTVDVAIDYWLRSGKSLVNNNEMYVTLSENS